MLRLDLGCGAGKAKGFVGFDRFPLPGVDIVGDLDKPLPFDTNSADLVYASHSLEHVPNIMGTMAEIYRVLRHGGQLCIVAPYSEQKLNIANPYHVAAFNEHTPRFWTNHPTASLDQIEYDHPHAPHWGIANSDHSTPAMDFRLVNMEFFYFPRYLGLAETEKRAARQSRIDVCDQVMYHLIAWKPDEADSGESFEQLLASFTPYVPHHVLARRAADKERAREGFAARTSARGVATASSEPSSDLGATMNCEIRETFHVNEQAHDVARTGNDDRIVEIVAPLVDMRQQGIGASEARLAEVAQSLSATVAALQNENARFASLRKEIEVSDELTAEYKADNEELRLHIDRLEAHIAASRIQQEIAYSTPTSTFSSQLFSVYDELSAYRQSRAQRLASYVRTDSLWRDVSPAFSVLKEYTGRHLRGTGYRLTISEDLRLHDYREYRMPMGSSAISEIALAINPIGSTTGSVGVEIVSAERAIVAQASVDLRHVMVDRPTVFRLPTTLSLTRGWYLRVFVQHTTAPVAIYELAGPALWRRRQSRRAFVSVQ